MASILLVEDDVDLAVLLGHVLEMEGYEGRVAHDAESALETFRVAPPDLALLDHHLPGMTGRDLCRQLRTQSSVPIIMLTANAEEDTIIGSLDEGADDYVVKPFRPRQLLARIHALLRRTVQRHKARTERIVVGPLTLDLATREVECYDRPVTLTPTEFQLLHYLTANAGRVLTFGQLIEHVWGYDGVGDGTLVRVHISRLRKKLEPPGTRPLLVSHPRVGYALSAG